MTSQEILEKAIQKAIDNGWDWKDFQCRGYFPNYLEGDAVVKHIAETMLDMRLYSLIFSHDFAKALWGESTDYTKVVTNYPDTPPLVTLWQNGYKYHLQQMVISDNRLEYLGQHI